MLTNKVWCTAVFLLWVLAGTAAFADQITLKNGDRISGSIVSSDGTSLNIKTDYAGTLAIKLDQVQSITSDQPLYVTSKDGTVLAGTVAASGDTVQVATRSSGTVTISRSALQSIRNESEQQAYGAWGGALNAGLSLARGNADNANFTLGANASRSTSKDKLSVFVNSLYSRGTTAGVTLTTASAVNGGLRYDFNLGARTFAYGFTDFDHDRFQLLDLRNVIGGGLGYHVIKSDPTTFDLFAGASLNQEFFSTGLTRRTGEIMTGEELDHKLSSSFAIKERLEFYPDLSSLGDYRAVFDTAAVTKLSKVLSWQLDLSDRFISDPILGLSGNDLLMTTGIRITFGRASGTL